MKIFELKFEQQLPVDIHTAWAFFSSPKNLPRITPPEMGFHILTPLNDESIYPGMIIDYTVKPLGLFPVHWKTEIGEVKFQKSFTDKQKKGPFKMWHHTHSFTKVDGGVLMRDHLRYQLPFGWLGLITHRLIIHQKLIKVFKYRSSVLTRLFPNP
jgi:ligand-binding SRPBCC domain-containing protein